MFGMCSCVDSPILLVPPACCLSLLAIGCESLPGLTCSIGCESLPGLVCSIGFESLVDLVCFISWEIFPGLACLPIELCLLFTPCVVLQTDCETVVCGC